MDDQIYYQEKNHNKKGFFIIFLSCIIFIVSFFCLNFFNINPTNTLKFLNNGDMSTAYGRDYIFSIKANAGTNIPELEILINESNNVIMSETLQDISLSLDNKNFAWRRFFKFDTAIIKTPYDTRNIKIDNYSEKYTHNYIKDKSNLTKVILNTLSKNSNVLIDNNKYETKKMKINFYENTFSEKIKLNYKINLDDVESTEIFNNIYDGVWNSSEFLSFFQEDNDIQNKIKAQNNTKNLLDIMHNLKNNIIIESSCVEILASKDFVESINIELKAKYNGFDLVINISEFLQDYEDEFSPEEVLEILSTVEFDKLTSNFT